MKYNYDFNEKLGITSIGCDCEWMNIKVHNLMQNTKQKQPSINAYLGARYSRSSDSITDIANEIVKNNIDAASRLEAIFNGYGHKSVGDMADVFVCIENVPMITAMRAFNINPTISGQERSTRFQNFQNPDYIKIPKEVKISKKLRDRYDAIILKQMNDYVEMLPIVTERFAKYFNIDMEDKQQVGALKARVFDTVRYFLPLGLKTSLGFIMSARNWSEYISRLRGSGYIIEKELGDILYTLLVGNDELKALGYIPEADGLVRHTEANDSRQVSLKEIEEYIKSLDIKYEIKRTKGVCIEDIEVNHSMSPDNLLISHLILGIYPNIDLRKFDFKQIDIKEISKIIFKYHHHNNQMGNVAQFGAYSIDGYADHGVLKDLNRHRSLERYVPMWESTYSMSVEFDRDIHKLFNICDYLYIKEFNDLKEEFMNRFSSTYTDIKEWYLDAKKEIDDMFASEFTKYLIPHAHSTRYRYYGSFDDLQYTINLRVRPGGHIAYRNVVYRWLELLKNDSELWGEMYNRIPKVQVDSIEQFKDRG